MIPLVDYRSKISFTARVFAGKNHGMKKAPRNRTLTLSTAEIDKYRQRLVMAEKLNLSAITNHIIHNDIFEALSGLPENFVDLLFIDPPYNLTKNFGGKTFKKTDAGSYEKWLDSWLSQLIKILKPNASIYICSDWQSTPAVYNAAKKYFHIQNRITWQREKGRGAERNWKNVSEDILFCTVSNDYKFCPERVRLKKKIIAPYRDAAGKPKDWQDKNGEKFRLTAPSNLWADISVPFWSMPENTNHPTQKPEKLLAKIILASSDVGDFVFDPFLGSGTAAVVAKKLGRRFSGVERDLHYCCLAEKRLEMAETDCSIQGLKNGVFLERNAK